MFRRFAAPLILAWSSVEYCVVAARPRPPLRGRERSLCGSRRAATLDAGQWASLGSSGLGGHIVCRAGREQERDSFGLGQRPAGGQFGGPGLVGDGGARWSQVPLHHGGLWVGSRQAGLLPAAFRGACRAGRLARGPSSAVIAADSAGSPALAPPRPPGPAV